MEKINLQIEKYTYVYDDAQRYFIYATASQEDKDYTDFHIQKENKGIISFCIGVNLKEMNCTNQEFINENIMDWIDDYEDEIEVLEEERELNK